MSIPQPGRPAPWFAAPTHGNASFHFNSLGGRYILLAFTPDDAAEAEAMCAALLARRGLFGLDSVASFAVLRSPDLHARMREGLAMRWFLDADGAVSRLYGALRPDGTQHPHWLLVDPSLRILASWTADRMEDAFAALARLPHPDLHAGTTLSAPVLIVPRIFEPQICRDLIAHYDRHGGSPSGVMQVQDGRTVPVLNNSKKRRDADIVDESFKSILRQRIELRLLPEIRKAFQFNPTRMERYIVAAYDAQDGGYFRPHRDNTTPGTAHRQFACSINLNAEDFAGGDLRFPEFGSRTYRPPTGGAVVFSCSLLHEATNVTHGRRYAFLPFFYDEAAARLREANAGSVAPPISVAEAQTENA